MLTHQFPFGSATSMLRALRQRKISSLELLDAYLKRVDRLNPAINAVVVQDRRAARAQARAADAAADRGEYMGPLHGLPMTVKEAFDLKGHATTFGYPSMTSNMATQDALTVQRLKAAGAVVFGKSNVPLNNGDIQTYNAVYGTTNNPWDLTRGAGGSSGGGAAAVAAGLSALEYGSDIGGSIRNPAAYCGVYGHKSTWGIVPKRGHQLARLPVAEADLGVLGPIARSAADLALAVKVTLGPDALTAAGVRYQLPAAPRELKGLRVAVWLDDKMAPVDSSVTGPIHAAAMALKQAGAKVDFKARPSFDAQAAHQTYMVLLAAQAYSRRPDFAQLQAMGQQLSPDDHSAMAMHLRLATQSFKQHFDAQQQRERLRWAWHDFFQRFDVLLAPVTTTAAFPHDHSEPITERKLTVNGQPTDYFAQLFWAGLATTPLLPATSAPVGFTPAGLPVGLQIIGPEMADLRTIWVAGQLERLLGAYSPPPDFV
ncbi:MAG: amidase [Hydrogenophaga sp.]